jgi:hypothetical protein
MRRNCPHCGADQTVADEKLTTGWVFLKCHHCAAVSPIQGRAAMNLAQAAEKPLRSEKAQSAKLEEPRVEITKSILKLPPVPEFLKSEPTAKVSESIKTIEAPKIIQTSKPSETLLSQALESEPGEPMVFEPESHAAQPVPILLEEEEAPQEGLEAAKAFAGKLKGDFGRKFEQFRPYALPLVMAVVCFGSGGYLIRSARLIRQGSWIFSAPSAALVASDVAPAADSVPQTDSSVAQAASSINSTSASRAPASVQAQSPSQAPVAAAAPAKTYRATVESKSKKIANSTLPPTSPSSEDKVQVLANNAVLRAGPGLHYNKVGTARAELQLLVKGSFDNWIEVRTGGGNKTAWIRSDLVKPLKEVAQQEAQP